MSVLSHTGIVTRDSVEKTKENVNNRDVLLGFTDWAVESGFGVQWGKKPPPPPLVCIHCTELSIAQT